MPQSSPDGRPPDMTCTARPKRRSRSILAASGLALAYGVIALAANVHLAQGAEARALAQDELPDPDGKPADMSKPVQVYVLLGQSNMLGAGKVKGEEGSLKFAVETKGLYPYLVDDAGAWTTWTTPAPGPPATTCATSASWGAAPGARASSTTSS